jgi:hypothetical protein
VENSTSWDITMRLWVGKPPPPPPPFPKSVPMLPVMLNLGRSQFLGCLNTDAGIFSENLALMCQLTRRQVTGYCRLFTVLQKQRLLSVLCERLSPLLCLNPSHRP